MSKVSSIICERWALRTNLRASMYCNICGNENFDAFSGRHNALCKHCKSTERHRLLIRSLFNEGVSSTRFDSSKLLIIDGNENIHDKLKNYFLAPDLSEISFGFPFALSKLSGNYDLIVHSHFLNNIDCNWPLLLKFLIESLSSGGKMYFTLPVNVNKPDFEFTYDYSTLNFTSVQEIKYGDINGAIYLDHLNKFLSKANGRFSHLKYPERELLEISAIGVDVFCFVKY